MEHLDLVTDPQAALERAYPRWNVWKTEETDEWWASVKVNLTLRERHAGCEPFRCAESPGELAELLDAEDAKAGVRRSTVRLAVWGVDKERVRTAYNELALHPVRPQWRVTAAASTTGGSCPVSVNDGAAITARAGDGWAYAVFPTGTGTAGVSS